jgi:hypothetical protein
MNQFHSALGKRAQACVRTASPFDDEINEIGHTPAGQGAFAQLPRQKSSMVFTPSCGFSLKSGQNRSRLIHSMMIGRP